VLVDLYAGALADAESRMSVISLADLERAAGEKVPALDAREALQPSDQVKIIAEVKRASPSRGPLADITDPASLALSYETGGASAISVLTEGRKFKGTLDDLRAVRDVVTVPLLRKDFIATPYQVFEARAAGADLVLLIVAGLDQKTLVELHTLIIDLGMTALIETHSADEVVRGLDAGATVLGVNARNLTTFELDQDLFGSLADSIPSGVVRVAESAVKVPADVAHYRRAGADVVLVGEALVVHGDPVDAITRFREAS